GSPAEKVTAKLVPFRNAAQLKSSSLSFGRIDVLDTANAASPFVFQVTSDSIRMQKFELQVSDHSGRHWKQSFVVNIKPQVEEIHEYEIADGRTVTFARGGNDTLTTTLGIGNGDGIPNPGESIVVLVKDNSLWQLSSLHSLNPHVDLK